jgi:hypothetical protein
MTKLKGSGTVAVNCHRSALYVKISPVYKVECFLRCFRQVSGTSAQQRGNQRIQMNQSSYAGDTVEYFAEVTGYCADNADVLNFCAINSPSTANGTTDITGTTFNFNSATRARKRTSSAFTPPTNGYDINIDALATTASLDFQNAFVVVKVSINAIPPTVSTTAVTNVTASTADSGGTITNAGSAAVTGYGVCWNTTGAPTIADAHTTDGP